MLPLEVFYVLYLGVVMCNVGLPCPALSEFNPVDTVLEFLPEDEFNGVAAVIRAVDAPVKFLNGRVDPNQSDPEV